MRRWEQQNRKRNEKKKSWERNFFDGGSTLVNDIIPPKCFLWYSSLKRSNCSSHVIKGIDGMYQENVDIIRAVVVCTSGLTGRIGGTATPPPCQGGLAYPREKVGISLGSKKYDMCPYSDHMWHILFLARARWILSSSSSSSSSPPTLYRETSLPVRQILARPLVVWITYNSAKENRNFTISFIEKKKHIDIKNERVVRWQFSDNSRSFHIPLPTRSWLCFISIFHISHHIHLIYYCNVLKEH